MNDSVVHPSESSAPALGATAPDFSQTDSEGKTRNLYHELGAGKPVVLFFMRGEW